MRNTDLNGVLVVDKPPGLSSAQVVSRVKKILGAGKVGHAGTLDPMATGVLVCLINRATRLSNFFLQDIKQYEATLCLGFETDTQDRTGRKLPQATGRDDVSRAEIETVLRAFQGEIQQIPPVFSALKYKGQPLYKYARQGEAVPPPAPRTVTIFSLTATRIQYPLVRFTVTCSGGTYIRTLCTDIGRRLGCGGHLQDLCRTEAAGFKLAEAVPLNQLESPGPTDPAPAAHLIGLNAALRHLPTAMAGQHLAEKIQNGRPLDAEDFPADLIRNAPGKTFQVTDGRTGRLLAVLQNRNQEIRYCCVFTS